MRAEVFGIRVSDLGGCRVLGFGVWNVMVRVSWLGVLRGIQFLFLGCRVSLI